MPSIVQGASQDLQSLLELNGNISYTYPNGLDLRPDSDQHNKIKTMLMQRANESAIKMSGRHKDWKRIDHTLTAYIPADTEELDIQDQDPRKPVSIVFPYSYTILETLLSYFTAAFLQDPIFRYEGYGPNDVIGSILLEKLIYFQCVRNKVGLNLHTMARDAFSYGFGAVTPTWVTQYGKKRVTERTQGFLGMGSREISTVLENQLLFEGNALENIDPYLYLPDPNIPIHEVQKGEFVGWISTTNFHALLREEENSPELFNVRYIGKNRTTSIFSDDASGRGTRFGMSTKDSTYYAGSSKVDVLKMFVDIIPKQYGLSNKTYPEKWYFELAGDRVIIKAKPLELDHTLYPISVTVPDYDGYSICPVSKVEILYGMQGVLDFLFNSHIANVRKAVNDMIIYDPYQVNSEDLRNPEPGKLIRLRRPAWGRGVKDVAMQLGVSDVTRANVADSSWIIQWMDRISGADSSMQGALRQGGPDRLTGKEFQGTRAGGMSRMERMAKVVGMQAFQDLGYFFAMHNKQFMSQDTFVKMAGDWQEVLMQEYGKRGIDRGRIAVSPQDLDINFNVLARDGSVPGGNYSDSWIQLFQILGNNQELSQQFDIPRIFSHIARNLGAKNVNDFLRRGGSFTPQAMPDEQVQQQAQAGNIIPINAMGGA